MLALVAALLCAPPAGRLLDLREATLSYRVVHKLHEVQGTTHEVEGRALVQPDGNAIVQVRAKLASFDSGNANRDQHMREVTHEATHPYASLKATVPGLRWPLPAPVEVTLQATVEVNGVRQPASIPARLAPEGPGLRATFSFPISLDAFHVERPKLLLVAVEDRVVIDGNLLFTEAPP